MPEIVDIEDVERPKRIPPLERLMEGFKDDYKTIPDMAKRYGVTTQSIRRHMKAVDDEGNRLTRAPSKALKQGKLVVYLYDKDDVAEMDEFMAERGYRVNDA